MGIEILVKALKKHQDECNKSIEENDSENAFISFMGYLHSLFALRENIGIMDKCKDTRGKADTVFGALKNIYESIKHKTDIDEVRRVNIFVSSKKYPYSYPYRYGPAIILFGEIDKVAEIKEKRDSKKRDKMIELHNKYLKDKSVSKIMQLTTEETKELTNEKTI